MLEQYEMGRVRKLLKGLWQCEHKMRCKIVTAKKKNEGKEKKLMLKVSNETKCPSDKYEYKHQARAAYGPHTPVTCRPNEIEIFKTSPTTT